ncbi:MAG TPA: protein-L-isoaspartate(D-aspartate) O-methyltransferase [Tepidisphaeraceae bacterium]|jgi:protein-L-isoaspartate(D-aspartate) O-methyltransferase
MNEVAEKSKLERMIQQQVIERGITDERVINALRAVPREKFFKEDLAAEAYADRAAPIGHGQTISQPYMVALMTERLNVQPTHTVLEIGTGSGYHAAILARLAKEVYSVERVKPLLDAAFDRLHQLGIRNVHFKYADGTLGWTDQAPFDRVLIAAGAPAIPRDLLLSQLADGGIAIVPVGNEEEQMLISVKRNGQTLVSEDVCPCRFVKLIGREGWEGK